METVYLHFADGAQTIILKAQPVCNIPSTMIPYTIGLNQLIASQLWLALYAADGKHMTVGNQIALASSVP